jgi:chaperonin GroEL
MATDTEKMICELDDPYILITDKKISSMKQIVPVLEKVASEGRSLLIIAEDVDGDAQAALILNIIRGALKVCAVKAPGFGNERKEMLEDIAVLTGGQVISEEKGLKLEEFDHHMLGSARKVTVDNHKTIIVEGRGDKAKINERVRIIEAQINIEDSDYRKTELKKRQAKLKGGVAVIKVGAATETELKEKRMRIDDALNATKAAVEEGVVTGGGVSLFCAAATLDSLKLEDDRQVGVNIIKRAIEEPMRQIATNAGREDAEVVATIRAKSNELFGYNAKKDVFEDLFEAGVIDPTKVVRSALQNAASIAGMLLTTEALVTDFDEEKDDRAATIII